MSSQISPYEKVHTGLWTDWTHGRAQGLTLTVTTSQGAYLIAFLAIFVRLAGSHLWDLLCYAWFHARQTTGPRDGLYHQQQALLRNNLSDNRAIWQFSAAGYAWRNKVPGSIRRTIPFLFTALIYFLSFSAAGIFSSNVASVQSTVLISGPVCGELPDVQVFNVSGMIKQAFVSTWRLSAWKNAQISSSSCHAYNTTGPQQYFQDCKAWGRQFVPWNVTAGLECPFANEMCRDGLTVQVETPFIDSHLHLGINAPAKDRIQMRNVMRCTPVTIDGFKSDMLTWNETTLSNEYYEPETAPVQGYLGYSYGEETTLGSNYTFIYYNTSFGAALGNLQAPSYMMDVEFADATDINPGTFDPIPQLNRTDADVALWFIMQDQLAFVTRVDDPIFQADVSVVEEVITSDGDLINMTYWTPSEPLTVLGCAQQWQWCNGEHHCTPLAGIVDQDISSLNYSARQQSLFDRIQYTVQGANMNLMTVGLGNDALLASTASGWGMAGSSLPNDQWMREVDHWYSMFWNSVQQFTAQYSVGDGVADQDKYRVPPSEEDKWMCGAQMVQRSDYSSFNMLGVLLILVLGAFFVLLNTALDPMIQWFRRRRARKAGVPWLSVWRRHHLLQIESAAFSEAGLGTWSHDSLVPTSTDAGSFSSPLAQQQYMKLDASSSQNSGSVYQDKIDAKGAGEETISLPSPTSPTATLRQDSIQHTRQRLKLEDWVKRWNFRKG
ncbi:hypothetical protein H2204_009256 [Knufia peltigerae]|uniref:Uncharacterized protein n=1 Tax=Knufia peltigerae TaxID=1002370 RepID=A0AA39CW47_9EURO|nr:hypothetical protein H2204_009256 [Knufia peltigerae]